MEYGYDTNQTSMGIFHEMDVDHMIAPWISTLHMAVDPPTSLGVYARKFLRST
ncbi:hypothetical protein [Salimicrobium humidisoli]|uniref:hypothetical protein n=1 Tax=Salimicrobium humidisoli TaxID=2029857 RepID=UPI001303F9A2|nr:hypothetical protein [Salimicrobium humidisoli]